MSAALFLLHLKTKSFAFLVSQFYLGDGRKTNKRLAIEIYRFESSLSHKIINIEGKASSFSVNYCYCGAWADEIFVDIFSTNFILTDLDLSFNWLYKFTSRKSKEIEKNPMENFLGDDPECED